MYAALVGPQPASPPFQHDIVIYSRSFPRIHLGGNINAFLCELVKATIEIKSTLDGEGVLQAVKAAVEAKKLLHSGSLGPSIGPIRNYIFAYKGPARMETVFGWIAEAHKRLNLSDPKIIREADRLRVASTSVDGIYVLGWGACLFLGACRKYSAAVRRVQY